MLKSTRTRTRKNKKKDRSTHPSETEVAPSETDICETPPPSNPPPINAKMLKHLDISEFKTKYATLEDIDIISVSLDYLNKKYASGTSIAKIEI